MGKTSIYLMHKYWGKKPANDLSNLIAKYSNENDLILDPFSGYGGVAIEGLFLNRNVIINDLNPIAVFISESILDENINILKAKKMFADLKGIYNDFFNEWYTFKENKILTILRDKNDTPLKLRVRKGKQVYEIVLKKKEQKLFKEKEDNYKITYWYPANQLITNSRISAKKGMRICDLFSKRALICQAYLFDKISNLENCPEKQLFMLAFTSNLANCSKLVPPIKSRGDMAQGAWMTGFYIGKTYLDNNVFHYFENRVNKIINGKAEYLRLRDCFKVKTTYSVLNNDAKKLQVKSKTVDFIFTDFPYGDTVPYFEQSQLWNSWLKYDVDYENEIVISDSPDRNKKTASFIFDIDLAIKDIKRVLKDEKFFAFTFHSISGIEWKAIIDSLRKNNFIFKECKVLMQKTLPPRQLNRPNSIKGDILAVYQSGGNDCNCIKDFNSLFEDKMSKIFNEEEYRTNDLIELIVKTMLETLTAIDISFKALLDKYFVYNEKSNKWRKR